MFFSKRIKYLEAIQFSFRVFRSFVDQNPQLKSPIFYTKYGFVYTMTCFFPSSMFFNKPGLFLIYYRSYQKTLQFLQQYTMKNVHPVSHVGIRTHDLLNVSLLP